MAKDPKGMKEAVEAARAAGLPEDVSMEDFQFVLQELLNAYRPILEEELALSKSAERLMEAAAKHPHTCEDEQLLADRIFAPLASEKVAVRLLDPQMREMLGPIDQWRWCLNKVLCCLRFGWLLSRARTFPNAVYYLYRYWLCVRRLLGSDPAGRPLTAEERSDFRLLVAGFAEVFKPYLQGEIRAADQAGAVAEEALGGRLDCHAGGDEAQGLFEKFLTIERVPLLIGRENFDKLRLNPVFWLCRCWCLCAFRFGWCLAGSRTFFDLLRCLVDYFRCLRRCFRPLVCNLTKPTGCTEEEPNPAVGGLTVTVVGTATGGFFDHYTLEWRKVEGVPCADNTGWQPTGISYPGGTPTGTAPVIGGILGWLDTTVLPAGSYEIRLCVYSALPNIPRCCDCTQFDLFKKLVWIERIANAPVQTPPGPFISTAPIVSGNPGGIVVPVGGCVTVKGSAFVGECNNRKIKCFDLRYGVGFLPGPGELGFNPADYTGTLLIPAPLCYTDPDPAVELKKRAQWNQIIGKPLTTRLVETEIEIFGFKVKVWKLQDYCFSSASLLPVGITAGGCPDPHHRCRSGKYTLLLQVEDTLGNLYYDTQQVWFDNKPITVEFSGIEGLASCTDMNLSKFVPPGAPCPAPWPVNLLGIAYDEYIDETDPTYPSNNFDFYTLAITRQGGPTFTVPISPDLVTYGPDPFKGTQRVGEPGVRCEPLPAIGGCPPPAPIPPTASGLLTRLDMRIFDADCVGSLIAPYAPVPPGFALKRGTCCGYTFQLYAQDKTWSDGWNGGYHHAWSLPWAVCICNDLRKEDQG